MALSYTSIVVAAKNIHIRRRAAYEAAVKWTRTVNFFMVSSSGHGLILSITMVENIRK